MVGPLFDNAPAEGEAVKVGIARQSGHQSFCQTHGSAIGRVRGGDDDRAISEVGDAVGVPDAGSCELRQIRKPACMRIVKFDRQDTERLAAF